MDDRYERVTIAVEDRHWWYRGRRQVLRAALGSLELPASARLLDAGCGSGRNMVELRAFGEVTGLELSEASVSVARARGVGEVMPGSLELLPFDASSFDGAAALDVIEHLEDDRGALRNLHTVVRPQGFLVVTVPAYQWLWSQHDELNRHCRRYTRHTLVAAAEDAGWHTLSASYFNSILLPVAVIARMFERVRPGKGAEVSEFERTPDWMNPLLERPMRAEAALIRKGVRLPAGLSILGLFRRTA